MNPKAFSLCISSNDWKILIKRTLKEAITDKISLAAAGCAFFATLALFPAISMLIFLYGLAFDTATIYDQLGVIQKFLPPEAYKLIQDRIEDLVAQGPHALGIGFALSVVATLWSSSAGTKSMISALNVAYEQEENRGFLGFQITALLFTLSAILAVAMGLAGLVAIPAFFSFLGKTAQKGIIQILSLVALVITVWGGCASLYRFAPSKNPDLKQEIFPGAFLATFLWILVSTLFSFYVAKFSSYDATYGSLGAVAGMMMWFYFSAYAVILGAEFNCEIGRQKNKRSKS